MLRRHESTKHIFPDPPITTYRRERNIRDRMVRPCDPQSSPGTIECKRPRCKTCAHILHTVEITGSNGISHHITSSFTCTSRNLIYAIVCQHCQMLYIGETKTALSTRFSDYLRSIRSNFPLRPVAAHFNSTGHTIEHAKITGIPSTSVNSDKDRHSSEQRIISKLHTVLSHGINIRFDMLKDYCITI